MEVFLRELASLMQRQQSAIVEDDIKKSLIGVTLHKRTQRYEAHIWQDKKQLYLGSYDAEAQAGRAHDILALRTKGYSAKLNYPQDDYEGVWTVLQTMTQADVISGLRQYSRSLSAARSQSAPRKSAPSKPRRQRAHADLSTPYQEATIGRKRRATDPSSSPNPYQLPRLDLFVRPRGTRASASRYDASRDDGVDTPTATPGAAAAAHALASLWQSTSDISTALPSPASPLVLKTVEKSIANGHQTSPSVMPPSGTSYTLAPAVEADEEIRMKSEEEKPSVSALKVEALDPDTSAPPAPPATTLVGELKLNVESDGTPVMRQLSFLSGMKETLTSG